MEEREIVRTIFHADVKDFFKKINLYNEFKQRKLFCKVCGKSITDSSFRIAKYIHNQWVFCCDSDLCLEKLDSINKSD